MTPIKKTSVIQENKENAHVLCPVTFVMEKIGGYWKPIIMFNLLSGTKRYSELKRSIDTITEKVLIQQLKQLENDGLVIRKSRPVVPPHVTYELSKAGKDLYPVLREMAVWATQHGECHQSQFSKQMEDLPKRN
ncbi:MULTISPECIES: helix-turn-helix domain-containing protein [unclassified Sphingobacterium]|uniref:winged helix-turn-helix transcriptional regulator n=1 Tax=unclassified Sphingobacterium TaxID=2609468 RepID=UPI002953790E|nr:helix-turn-helix domain-containing protein [Sphingobacterium sp. UGAL515B_05]WON93580.1 helix-turn-helix transcriptional regulator [Sphingobacterium sp. UGAL515B_05]